MGRETQTTYIRTLALSIGFSLLIWIVPLDASAKFCGSWFEELGRDLLGTKAGNKIHRAVAKTGRLDSIRVAGRVKGVFGFDRHVVELKPGRKWGDLSQYPPHYNDIVLDPREIVSALGPENAKKLGYEIVGDKLIIPGPEELNAAFTAFNRSLPKGDKRRILLSFYSTNDEVTSGAKYINAYSGELKLPMAREGHLLLHDTSAHAGAAFIPPEIFADSQRKIGASMGFLESLRMNQPALAKSAAKAIDRTERIFVGAIDAGSNDLQNTIFKLLGAGDHGFDRGAGRLTKPFDDVGIVTTEDFVREIAQNISETLSPKRKLVLQAEVESYLIKLRALDSTSTNLPYGLDREEILRETKGRNSSPSWAIYNAIVEKEKQLITEHSRNLRQALSDWNGR